MAETKAKLARELNAFRNDGNVNPVRAGHGKRFVVLRLSRNESVVAYFTNSYLPAWRNACFFHRLKVA